jgi:hypothetical protein
MRLAVWALIASLTLAGLACQRRSLQEEDGGGGPGSIGLDGGGPRDGGGGPFATDGASPPVDGWSPPVNGVGNCGVMTTRLRYIPRDMLIVQDRAIAGDQAAGWRDLLSAMAGHVSANVATVSWGLYVFPKDGPACDAATVTTAPDLPITSDMVPHLIAHLAEGGTGGDGTPTAAAIAAGAAYLRTLPNEKLRTLLLLTDGAPSCAGTIGALSDDAVQAQIDAVAAIAAANAEGLQTLVVAPSTATDVGVLNALALAGGQPREGDLRFYTESTVQELFAASNHRACTIALANPPPVPRDVSVLLNGVGVPRDSLRMNGWEYADPPRMAIQLYGMWCQMLNTTVRQEITIVYGCPLLD